MGKTETGKMFADLGIPVFDADAAVHKLYEHGGAAVGLIAEAYPGCVKDGAVDRSALAARVASDAEGLVRLEKIVHPLVALEQNLFLDMAKAAGSDMVILDIPLLFETGGGARLDAVVVVSAPQGLQRSRVLSRPGMTPEKLDHILARQMPDAEKRAQAHFVVETDKGFDHARAQVENIVATLRRRRR
ncbi:MAG: dephospho-CoA kinase [Alphaproteobacteria bacterium]|nr:dephospho-CoA kinase [Alphaproteobacteria bacterium]